MVSTSPSQVILKVFTFGEKSSLVVLYMFAKIPTISEVIISLDQLYPVPFE